jgi:hypothetical protein
MHRRILSLSIAAFLIAPAVFCFSQADHSDAFTGTWKLNPAKSSLSAGKLPKSETVTVAPDGTTTVEAVDTKNASVKFSYPFSHGQEVAIAGIPNATCTQTNTGNEVNYTMKFGDTTIKAHVVLSGTTMTRTYDASDNQGHMVHGVSVYEKVK